MSPATYSKGNPCLEYELDEYGCLIGHSCEGFKLTARALALRRQKWQKYVGKGPPMTQLPVDLRPKRPDDGTPLLHYGFVVSNKQFMACVKCNNIVNDETHLDARRLYAGWGVTSFVCRETRAMVHRERPLSMDHKYDDEYNEEDEREIIDIIKKELQIPEEVLIMWWWDIGNGPGPRFDCE